MHHLDQPRPVVAVARAQHVRGIEDQVRQAGFAHRALAQEFAALVIDPAVAAALRHVLAQGVVHQMRIGRDAGGMHETADAGGLGRAQQAPGAGDVGVVLLGLVADPGAGVGGAVEHRLRAARRRQQRLGVGQAAAHRHRAGRRQGGIGCGRTRQRAHRVAVRQQLAQHMAADETAGARDQYLCHSRLLGPSLKCMRTRAGCATIAP